jgi:putative flippase GtrA
LNPARARWIRLGRRWLKFNFVGAVGILVQLGVLTLLKSVFRLHYLAATGIAVEVAILHNFVWHEHYTWVDRTGAKGHGVLKRLFRFNLSTGAISIVGNLVLMRILVGHLHLVYIAANLLSIGACALLNFAASDLFVFERRPATAANSDPR